MSTEARKEQTNETNVAPAWQARTEMIINSLIRKEKVALAEVLLSTDLESNTDFEILTNMLGHAQDKIAAYQEVLEALREAKILEG